MKGYLKIRLRPFYRKKLLFDKILNFKFFSLVNFTMVHDDPKETVNNTLAVRYRTIKCKSS